MSVARIWRFAFGAATLLILFFLGEGWLLDIQSAGGRLVAPSRPTVASVVPTWIAWAVLAPLAIRFFRAHPVDGTRPERVVAVYGAGALAFAIAHGLLSVPVFLWGIGIHPVPHRGPFGEALRVFWWSALRAPSAIAHFVIFGALYHAVRAWKDARDREYAALSLREALVRAKLEALKLRLEPHFLFNTLNAINAYIRTSPATAERMVSQLSRLLRAVLDLRDAHEIPLSHELSLVDSYLGIQQLRFGTRLHSRIVADPDGTDALVPSLLLQPLVENAVDHGLAKRTGIGHIEITACVRASVLHLRVAEWGGAPRSARDDEARHRPAEDETYIENPAASRPAAGGIGLSTTRGRLAQLYGNAAALRLVETDNRSEVSVTLPYHTRPIHP